ncbi:MAG: outer membrane beta-barrel protein [Muribaculaceae bacterium]|nr:outer membrane beta-barrel protein [Muribaculaceae bacterium]
MTRHFLHLLLAAALIIPAASQARTTEISASYGIAPAMRSLGAYHHPWHTLDNWGAVNVTFDHSFAPNLWVGLSYTLSSSSSDTAYEQRYGKITYHGLMTNVRYHWCNRGPVSLYSHAGVGVLVEYFSPSWEDSYNRTTFAFQVSPLGIEFNILPGMGLFGEVGYGVQGIAKVGFRLGF